MTASNDLDRALAEFLQREARSDGAAALLERTLVSTRRRRPRPAWLALMRATSFGRSMGRDDRRLRWLRYVAVAALALAAMAIGALLLAGTAPPRPTASPICVGAPATLCRHPEGAWASAVFLPGLTMTFPNDVWYARDLPDRIELKTPPMTSQVTMRLDPVPDATTSEPNPDRSGDVASLIAWLRRDPTWTVEDVGRRTTPMGLALTRIALTAIDPGGCNHALVPRGAPDGTYVLEACHYGQRLYLLDIGNGHVLSILLVAFDGQVATLDRLDVMVAPVIESIVPPASLSP
jgi:hypothetical protein